MQTEIEIQHPLKKPNVPADFLAELDRIDPLICSRERLVDLYRQAPDAEVRAFLVGIMDTRTMVALITETEKEFEMEQKVDRVPVDKAERQRQKRIMLWCAAVAILGMPAAAITGWGVWWIVIPGAWFVMIMLSMQKLWRNWYHEEE